MYGTGLRAVVFALFGLGIAVPACAGQVEVVRDQYAIVKTVCDNATKLLEGRHTGDAEAPVRDLAAKTPQLLASVQQLQKSGNDMSQRFGDAWTPTVTAMTELDGVAEAAAAIIMHDIVPFQELRDECTAAGSALDASIALSQTFGREYWALMNGPIENASALFQNDLSDDYDQAMELLDPEHPNIADGQTVMGDLKSLLDRNIELTHLAMTGGAALARSLGDALQVTDQASIAFQIQAGLLGGNIRDAYDLGAIKAAYLAYGQSMNASYTLSRSFGDTLRGICESCR